MTAYFDTFGNRVEDLRKNWISRDFNASTQLDREVEKIHYDVCLVTSEPGFPPDLREAVHLVFLRYLPEPMPTAYRDLDLEFSVGDQGDGPFQAALRMGGHLHDLFHELGRRGREAPQGSLLSRFTDKPPDPMRQRVSDEEEFRIVLARRTPEMAAIVEKFDIQQQRIQRELDEP